MPQDFKDALIVPIFKKGDRSQCGNHRGIFLLSVAGKILARILLRRLQKVAENVLPESQAGFRAGRGTVDMVFSARQILEKCREQQMPTAMIFYDLEKAFDSVTRSLMWDILERYGCPRPFVLLIRGFHDGMQARVLAAGSVTDSFEVGTGLKQGCVLAPTLFSLFMAAALSWLPDNLPGIDVNYRTDGGVFNLSRLRARRGRSSVCIRELQYADDNAVSALSLDALRLQHDAFLHAYTKAGMRVNGKKTKVLYQPGPADPTSAHETVLVNGEEVERVDSFPYLGSVLTAEATCGTEIERRLGAAHGAFGKLYTRVFGNHDLSAGTKVMVYRAVVVSTLLYGSETWTAYRRDIKKIERFHQSKLRTILNIKWQDLITNNEVLSRAGCISLEATVARHRLRWSGHVVRMEDDRLPKSLFYGELQQGARPRGAPKKRYKDYVKSTLKKAGIRPETWEAAALDRTGWRGRSETVPAGWRLRGLLRRTSGSDVEGRGQRYPVHRPLFSAPAVPGNSPDALAWRVTSVTTNSCDMS